MKEPYVKAKKLKANDAIKIIKSALDQCDLYSLFDDYIENTEKAQIFTDWFDNYTPSLKEPTDEQFFDYDTDLTIAVKEIKEDLYRWISNINAR